MGGGRIIPPPPPPDILLFCDVTRKCFLLQNLFTNFWSILEMARPLLPLLLLPALFSVSQAWWLWDDSPEATVAVAEDDPVQIAIESPLTANSDQQQPQTAIDNRTEEIAAAEVTSVGVPEVAAEEEEERRRREEKMAEVIAAHESHLDGGNVNHVDEHGEHNPEFDHQVCCWPGTSHTVEEG